MSNSATAQFAILGSAITALTLTLAACGGGGTSSGAGAGGSAVASVSGTVNGGSASVLEMHPGVGPAHLISALGELVIPAAYAAGVPGVNVVVNCPGAPPYAGVTDGQGKFRILTPEVSVSTSCSTAFDGAAGPAVTVAPGMETEIEVTLAGNTVNLVGVEQRANDSPQLEIEVDDGAGSVVSSNDDAISDGPSDDAVSNDAVSDADDSRSVDQVSNDDQSSGGTGTS